MREIRTSGSMSGDGKRSVAAWPQLPRPSSTLPKRRKPRRRVTSAFGGVAEVHGRTAPVTSEREKISFHQLNKKTGHRVKYRKVDAESGDEVDSADIIKGYEVGKGDYIELDPEELEAVAIESKRTIDIDEFVPKDEIDELYLNNPYYIAPDGEVGQ